MHDPLNVGDLVDDELRQRRESGYDVSALEAQVADLPRGARGVSPRESTQPRSPDRLEEIYLDAIRTRRQSDWAYSEPDTMAEILAALPAHRQQPGDSAGFAGIGGTVLGAAALPARFVEPLHDRTRSAILGYNNARISELAKRTLRLVDEGGVRSAA